MWKKIHDRVSLSKKLAALSYDAFRVWFFVLPNSDMHGRYSADPTLIKAQCLPRVTMDDLRVTVALKELAAANLIHPYVVGSDEYFVYHDHQEHNPGKLKYQKSKWPAPINLSCPCLNHEECNAVKQSVNGDTIAISHSHSLSHSQSSSTPDRSDPAGMLATVYCNKNKGIIGFEKCKHICDFYLASGIDYTVAEVAIWNSSKGVKVWEILEPIRPKNGKQTKSWAELMQQEAKHA